MANYSELSKLISDGDLHKVKEVFDNLSISDVVYNENAYLFTVVKKNNTQIEEYLLGLLKTKMKEVAYSFYIRRDELSEFAIIRYLSKPQIIKYLDDDKIKTILNYANSLKIIPFEILKKTLTSTNADKKLQALIKLYKD
jgi:hypothetical protein